LTAETAVHAALAAGIHAGADTHIGAAATTTTATALCENGTGGEHRADDDKFAESIHCKAPFASPPKPQRGNRRYVPGTPKKAGLVRMVMRCT
jgi:hypothetical protein